MLANAELDLILILSPSELHVPQSLLCLQYGKHIFIEKPLANTLSEVDQLEKARLEAGDRVVFVGYMRRYASAVEVVKERLKGKGIRYVRVRELIGSVSLRFLFSHLRSSSRLRSTSVPPTCGGVCPERYMWTRMHIPYITLITRMNTLQPNQQPTHSTPLHPLQALQQLHLYQSPKSVNQQ